MMIIAKDLMKSVVPRCHPHRMAPPQQEPSQCHDSPENLVLSVPDQKGQSVTTGGFLTQIRLDLMSSNAFIHNNHLTLSLKSYIIPFQTGGLQACVKDIKTWITELSAYKFRQNLSCYLWT